MTASKVTAIVVLAVTVFAGVELGLHRAGAAPAADNTVMSVTPSSASIGDVLRVDLAGWPQGNVTAAVCGNAAQRGSTDCDLIGAGSIRIGPSGTESLTVTVQAPPVGCPCVVRAAMTDGSLVRTAPITVDGVPTGVNLPAAAGPASTDALQVTASVSNADVGWPESWWPAFAGPAHKVLVLSMHNHSLGTISGLRVVGEFGHVHTDEGQPIGAKVPDIAAGETLVLRVPFTIAAPVWGTYSVHGTVYGLAAPLTFRLTSSSEPWALELALPLALLLIAQLIRHRDRVQRQRADAAAAAAPLSPAEFPHCSPVVGVADDGHWESRPYDRRGMAPDISLAPSAPDEERNAVLVEERG
jgi:hypothetical protein